MYNHSMLLASSLQGNMVKNRLGEKLGSVKDIMICTSTNEIKYYVLSFGGFLGFGDKLFAIPPQAMQLNKEDNYFLLNVEKNQLENAEGFDKDSWLNMSDSQFRDRIYTHYGYDYPHHDAA